jgi:hypothetical protein
MKPRQKPEFDVESFLNSLGIAARIKDFRENEIIFSQGDPAREVLGAYERVRDLAFEGLSPGSFLIKVVKRRTDSDLQLLAWTAECFHCFFGPLH